MRPQLNHSIVWCRDKGKSAGFLTHVHFNGRGFYFEDPNGHLLEVITRPCGYAA